VDTSNNNEAKAVPSLHEPVLGQATQGKAAGESSMIHKAFTPRYVGRVPRFRDPHEMSYEDVFGDEECDVSEQQNDEPAEWDDDEAAGRA
jgi:hypothetical protein